MKSRFFSFQGELEEYYTKKIQKLHLHIKSQDELKEQLRSELKDERTASAQSEAEHESSMLRLKAEHESSMLRLKKQHLQKQQRLQNAFDGQISILTDQISELLEFEASRPAISKVNAVNLFFEK